MPIANCFIKDTPVSPDMAQTIASEWSEKIQVGLKDVCLTFIPHCIQGGQLYKILVNLYLPSLWSPTEIERIQKGLLSVLCNHFHCKAPEIFIMASIIQSGHVLENGQIVEW